MDCGIVFQKGKQLPDIEKFREWIEKGYPVRRPSEREMPSFVLIENQRILREALKRFLEDQSA